MRRKSQRDCVRTVDENLGVGAVQSGATDCLPWHVGPVEVARVTVDIDADGRLTWNTARQWR